MGLILGLKESLDVLLENGLRALYAKQWALTMLTRASLTAMGLELFAKEQDFLSNMACNHKMCVNDTVEFSRQILNTSIGKTFLGMFLKM